MEPPPKCQHNGSLETGQVVAEGLISDTAGSSVLPDFQNLAPALARTMHGCRELALVCPFWRLRGRSQMRLEPIHKGANISVFPSHPANRNRAGLSQRRGANSRIFSDSRANRRTSAPDSANPSPE